MDLTVQQFNAPIPGQSLTDTPKNAPYEHPPQFVKLDDALNFIFTQLNMKANMAKAVALLDKGIPPEALADTTLFTGFTKGKWTPDLMLMLKFPVTIMYVSIAQRFGVGLDKPIRYKQDKTMDDLINIHTLDTKNLGSKFKGMEPVNEKPQPAPVSTDQGFLARG